MLRDEVPRRRVTNGSWAWMCLAGALLLAGALPSSAAAQYFGRNKVQYETFDFRIMRSERFDVYFYPPESLKVSDATRMAERWYARHSVTLNETFSDKKPIVFYANHPDFQQTNILGGFISQGTGGATESGRDRLVMPFTGVYEEDDRVLGHEMAHEFQFDIAADPASGPPAAANRLPLWFTEGMAEYLAVGRRHPLTAMWMRDAALRNDLPTIDQLTNDPRYFPYRYGQALWAYIGGVWGDEAVGAIYRAALRVGYEEALQRVTGLSADTLSKRWLAAVRATYAPVLAGRTAPGEVGTALLPPAGGELGQMDVSPSVSPDGRYVAFFTRRGIFTVDLYVADATTGRIVAKLTGPNTDSHFDAISFINSSGAWSPDGGQFAFVTQVQGDNAIAIYDVRTGKISREIRVRGVGEITSPAWGPNGQIAFSGNSGGITDLYILDLRTERVQQLMRDRYADLQPSWSPDGRTIAFTTDRGPGTNFEQLRFAPVRIALLDVATGAIRLLPLFDGARQINPQWTPDGSALYFISDPDGFSDIYRVALATGSITRVTRVATGVSGITALSPALSVASGTGRLVFSVFDRGGNTIRRLEPSEAEGEPLTAPPLGGEVAGVLPPVDARGRVAEALSDVTTGLPPTGDFPITPYRPRLSLEYLGSPNVGISVGGPFGTQGSGGITGYFTDMLNNNIVGVTAQLQGQSFRDFGGQLLYLNQRRRVNYYTSGTRIPILAAFATARDTTLTVNGGDVAGEVFRQYLQRLYINQLAAGVQYPFSQTRRVEFGLTATRLGYFTQSYSLYYTEGGAFLGQEQKTEPSPPAVTYYQASAALVGDYSFFGFTSPVAGGRYRFEVSPTVGAVTFQSVLADYRRYLFANPVTIALRGIGFARLGKDAESGRISPLYVGYPGLVRGYDANSFGPNECTQDVTSFNACPEFDRLVGSRMAVTNVELRVPLLGAQGFGLINFPYLPTEIAPFLDAGVTWTSASRPELVFERNTPDRVPVVSTGVTARFNVLGALVLEVFYAVPFQRPQKRSVIGFQLAPGW